MTNDKTQEKALARRDKFIAKINHNGKQRYLGIFPTAQLTHDAYCDAARAAHGEFARMA